MVKKKKGIILVIPVRDIPDLQIRISEVRGCFLLVVLQCHTCQTNKQTNKSLTSLLYFFRFVFRFHFCFFHFSFSFFQFVFFCLFFIYYFFFFTTPGQDHQDKHYETYPIRLLCCNQGVVQISLRFLCRLL